MNNDELLQSRFSNGMLMLPFFHRDIVFYSGNIEEYSESFLKPQIRNRFARIISLLKGLSHIKVCKSDILMMTTTLHNIESKGVFINNLYGAYYDMYRNRTLLIEDADRFGMWRKRGNYPNVSYINTYFMLLAIKFSSILTKIKTKDRPDYTPLINRYPALLNKKVLSRNDYFVSIYSSMIKWLLKKVKPKILLLGCASYGNYTAVVCKLAKEMGIKVIELQHGSTLGNSAYQKLDNLKYDKDYYDYLPDCYFTFGDYWKKSIGWAYEKFSVGNAYLNRYIESNGLTKPKYDYLVLSQPFNGVGEFVKTLSSKLYNKTILLRLHPQEDWEDNRRLYEGYDNVILSHGTSLYDDIINCSGIVGWSSTCLFEVLAFGKVPIVIDCELSRAQFPSDLGIWVQNPEDVLKLDIDDANKSVDVTYYWKGSFESNVSSYLERYL